MVEEERFVDFMTENMDKRKHSKFQEVNEYGEISVSPRNPERKPPYSWEARFLKTMIVLLIVTVLLIIVFNQ